MILVTGGTGLIGTHLIYDLLSAGKKVRALRRNGSDIKELERIFGYYFSSPKELAAKIEWVEGDVTDPYSLLDAMEGVEHVYHGAAMVSFAGSKEKAMLKANVEGTANVVNAAMEKKIKKLCHVSSVAALGDSERGEVITEDSYWRSSPTNSGYAISKYGAEREVWRGIEEGLKAVIVNPSIVLGPGNAKSSAKIIHAIKKGLRFYPTGEAGWVDVRDVSKAMIQLMESDITSERYIISACNDSFYNVFSKAAESMGKRKPSIKAGWFLSAIGWRAEKIRSFLLGRTPVVTKSSMRSAALVNHYSNEKIKKALGFEFIPIEKSLKDAVSALKY